MELKLTGAGSHARRFEVISSLFNNSHVLALVCEKLAVGKVDSIACILRRHPGLTTLHDPPHLAGQRIHYVMVFHFDREETPKRSLMRSRAWTDLSTKSSQTISVEAKRRSKKKAERVFDVAKKAFESGNIDEIWIEVTAEKLMGFMN